MTLIISWLNKENDNAPSIWTAGDTKISNGKSTLTLYGSKILELPLRCKDISTVFQETYFETKLTFAFAGSSLTGLNIYSSLYTILTNLGGVKSNNSLPHYLDILSKAATIFDNYYRTIQSPTEILIAGFCPKTNQPFQGKIKPEFDSDGIIKTKINTCDFSSHDLVFDLLGDRDAVDEVRELILKKSYFLSGIKYWRVPKDLLKEIIEKELFQTIGGNIQLAINSSLRFDLYSICEPIKGQEPKATLKFRNLDVFEDIGSNVGECVIAINGMV